MAPHAAGAHKGLLLWLLALARADVLFSGALCFVEELEAGRVVQGELQVYGRPGVSRAGGTVEVAAWGQGGAEKLRRQLTVASAKVADFSFDASSAGTHRICITPSARMELSLRLRVVRDKLAPLPSPWRESDASLLARVQELQEHVNVVRDEQMRQRRRTLRFSGAGESAHLFTMWFAGGELVALIAAGLWQLQALRAAPARRGQVSRAQKPRAKVA